MSTDNLSKSYKGKRVAKYRPQLSLCEIDLITKCLSAALVSGYNNAELPALVKKFKLLQNKIELDAIEASYTVRKVETSSETESPAEQKATDEDSSNVEDSSPIGDSHKQAELELSSVEVELENTDSLELDKTDPEYAHSKWIALDRDDTQLTEAELELVAVYKANKKESLDSIENARLSAYMTRMLDI